MNNAALTDSIYLSSNTNNDWNSTQALLKPYFLSNKLI